MSGPRRQVVLQWWWLLKGGLHCHRVVVAHKKGIVSINRFSGAIDLMTLSLVRTLTIINSKRKSSTGYDPVYHSLKGVLSVGGYL